MVVQQGNHTKRKHPGLDKKTSQVGSLSDPDGKTCQVRLVVGRQKRMILRISHHLR